MEHPQGRLEVILHAVRHVGFRRQGQVVPIGLTGQSLPQVTLIQSSVVSYFVNQVRILRPDTDERPFRGLQARHAQQAYQQQQYFSHHLSLKD